MSNQAQCPNCGGYKISSTTIDIKQKMPKSTSKYLKDVFWALVLLVFLGFVDSQLGSPCSGIAFIVLLVVLFQRTEMKKIGEYFNFTCLLCGYRWEWREGQPWPKVKVNPDLIAKGAQKLEEEAREAEEERKRQEALYHLSKLGKK